MDYIDAASAFLGTGGSGMQDSTMPSETHTITGLATSDSEDGLVRVDLMGYTVSQDGEQSLELPTTVDVKEGDTVQVTLVGGTGKSPIVTGVVGGGDRLSGNVQDAVDAATSAAEAVSSVTNYFFHNESGAHVTTTPNDATTGNNVLINANGLDVRDGSTPVAYFHADSAQVGRDDETHMTFDYNSVEIDSGANVRFFFAGDLRDEHGRWSASDSYIGDGSTATFQTKFEIDSNLTVSVNGATKTYGTDYTDPTSYTIRFTTAPPSGAAIVISYTTTSFAPTEQFGTRTGGIGGFSVAKGKNVEASGTASFAVGENTVASGYVSHAEGLGSSATSSHAHAEGFATAASAPSAHSEGYNTTASGEHAHAEGKNTTASGANAHAEGNGARASGGASHAEGASTASGGASHAEGSGALASGQNSHAEGQNTRAASMNQHAIGRFNVSDSAGTYAEIVGNGTADNARSNSRTLDWSGNEELQGELYLGGCSANGETPYPAARFNTGTSYLEYYDGSAWQNIQTGGGVQVGDVRHNTTSGFAEYWDGSAWKPSGPRIYTGTTVMNLGSTAVTERTLWQTSVFNSTFHCSNITYSQVFVSNGDTGSGTSGMGPFTAERWTSGTYAGWHVRWVNGATGNRRFNWTVIIPAEYSTV